MIKQQIILCLALLAGSLLLVPVSGSACGFNWYPLVRIEYPDNKELKLDYRDDKSTHPMKAELVKGGKSIAVQLDSAGLVKQQSAIFKGIR